MCFSTINTFSGADYSEDPARSITLETYLQAQALSSEAIIPGFEEEQTRPPLTRDDLRRDLERYLRRLSALEIPGNEHVEAYLRDL